MPHENWLQSANFNRPPRIQLPQLEARDIEIPSPPAPADPPEANALITILPIMGIGIIALFYVGRAFGDSSTASLLFAIPMVGLAGFSIAGAFFAQYWRRKQYEKRQVESERQYLRQLWKQRAQLQAANLALSVVLELNYADTAILLQRGLARDSQIWERRPEHHDFMQVRIGRGRVPSIVKIKLPDDKEDSPLLDNAVKLADAHRYLENAPIIAPLTHDASLTFCGRRNLVMDSVRSAVCQIAMNHAPQDLHIHLVAPLAHHPDWQFLKWLPHTSQKHEGNNPDFIAYDADRIRNLMGMLSQVIDARRSNRETPRLPHLMVIIDDPELLASEIVSKTMLREGQELGVSTLIVTSTFEQAPGDTQAIVECADNGQFRYIRTQHGDDDITGYALDRLSSSDATHLSRSMSGIIMPDPGSAGRIPQRVDFLEMYGVEKAEDIAMLLHETWQRDVEDTVLPFPVPIGRESLTNNTYLMLDEDNHGPHGVLAGTTGSGKSELLQTLICALAIEHDPRLLNLLLIDFKGGSSFRSFRDLPHTVGMVTNLDGVEIRRALEAMKAEVEYRQEFLKDKNMRDITQYHQFYARNYHQNKRYTPLPHLLIVVDEFAQLAKEMPDFMRELVRIVQVGRSLGLHLILGTQSPMDIITDEMNANLQFRICLRVQSVESSRAMLRRPDAAYLPVGLPGRGYLQVGERGLFRQFQTAYVGDDYHLRLHGEDGQDEAMHLELITEKGERVNLLPDIRAAYPTMPHSAEPYTLAHAVSDQVSEFSQKEGLMQMPALLLPPLAEQISLATPFLRADIRGFNGEDWDEPAGTTIATGSAPIGILDDIYERTQDPLWIHLNTSQRDNLNTKDGHLLVLGGPSSGKTTLLQSLALSEATLHPPEKLHMYFLSFTGMGLDTVSELPHAEKVIYGTENERVRRLFGLLVKTLEARANNLEPVDEAIKILFIDQYEQFRDAYWETHMHALERLIQEGRAVGIYVVITVSSLDAIPDRFRSLIPQRVALQLNNNSDYDIIVGRTKIPPDEQLPPGRGYLHHTPPLLFQTSLPSVVRGHPNHAASQQDMKLLVKQMRDAYQKHSQREQAPAAIRNLPDIIPLHVLHPVRSENGLITTLGYQDDIAITPYTLDWAQHGPHYIVTGPPSSGKTNLLIAAALQAASQMNPQQLRIVLADFNDRHLRVLRDLKHVTAYVTNPSDFSDEVARMSSNLYQWEELVKAGEAVRIPSTVIMIDDYDMVSEMLSGDPMSLRQLRDSARQYSDLPFHIWVSGYMERTTDPLMRHLMLRRVGFAFGSRESLQRLYWHSSGLSDAILPEGRAYVPQRNAVGVVQIAHVEDPAAEIKRINALYADYAPAQWGQMAQQPAQEQPPTPLWDEAVDGSLDIDTAGLLEDLLGGAED